MVQPLEPCKDNKKDIMWRDIMRTRSVIKMTNFINKFIIMKSNRLTNEFITFN